jgi:hypothetical protein
MSSSSQAAFGIVSGVLGYGRSVFFGSDLPVTDSKIIAGDDRLLQPGFIGDQYEKKRLVVVGIMPGNGSRKQRSQSDSEMMPILHAFNQSPTPSTFEEAMKAQLDGFPHCRLGRRSSKC